jgi:signal transduction histidine kinase
MLLLTVGRRWATAIRAAGLGLIAYTVLDSAHAPALHGRGAVVLVLLIAICAGWVAWMVQAWRGGVELPALVVLAITGGALTAACPSSAASACLFIAVATAAVRRDLLWAGGVGASGVLALGVGSVVYSDSATGALAYTLGLAVAALAAANSRGSVQRAEQAELLLAQTQRTHEEQLRLARLEESTRIAREIHDVLAHAMAGLTIQLEASAALLEQGADRAEVLERLRRAEGLARSGLQETRRAVGALRGETPSVADALRGMAAEYRDAGDAPADLVVTGPTERLSPAAAQAIVRITQEALTNIARYARGAPARIGLTIGDRIELAIANGPGAGRPADPDGGGYGIRGMRERAELLGGTLQAGPDGTGWRVALSLPVNAGRGASLSLPVNAGRGASLPPATIGDQAADTAGTADAAQRAETTR